MDETEFPVLRRYEVSVGRYGTSIYIAPTRGKAMADAYRSDAFEGWTWLEFKRVARARRTIEPPGFGEPCTFQGKPARCYGYNNVYVIIQLPGRDFLSHAHPYDIMPLTCRPMCYRDREHA